MSASFCTIRGSLNFTDIEIDFLPIKRLDFLCDLEIQFYQLRGQILVTIERSNSTDIGLSF